MTTRILFLVCAALLSALSASAQKVSTAPFAWSDLPRYEGSPTRALLDEQRFRDFLRARLPRRRIRTKNPRGSDDGETRLFNYAIEALHGLSDPITLEQARYYVLSACRVRACEQKGLLIMDAKTKQIVSLTTWFFPNNVPSQTPDILVAANRGLKTDKDAGEALEKFAPLIRRWIDAHRIKFGGFTILTDAGELVYRPSRFVKTAANPAP